MNRKLKNRRAFAAAVLCVVLLLACFSGAAFADSGATTKSATVPVEFSISAPQLSFEITESVSASNDGKSSTITYTDLKIQNTGAAKIKVDSIAFTANADALMELADKNQDFANMSADIRLFSLVAKHGTAEAQTEYDFGGSSGLTYNISQLVPKNSELKVSFEGQTAPYTENFNDKLGTFVVTVSKAV